MDKNRVFLLNQIFPNAKNVFQIENTQINESVKNAIVVLDTNVLLIPYTTSSSSFDEINKTFKNLIEERRLFIPSQVAREFAKNRPEKIKDLFQQLNQTKSKISKTSTGQYPLLENIETYKEALAIEKNITALQNEYAKKLSELSKEIKNWSYNDPVSEQYHKLFTPDIIIDLELDEDEIIKELEKRNQYNIPPGFKDKSKDDFGSGDLIIWFTILQIADKEQKDIIFLSGDEKNDWFYRSENQSLFPRLELINEFKHKCPDLSFHILKLSELLTLIGANEEAILEIETKEKFKKESSQVNDFAKNAESSIYDYLQVIEDKKDIFTTGSVPTFIIKNDRYNEAVEVVPIQANSKTTEAFNVIRQIFTDYSYKLGSTAIDYYRIFVVCENKFLLERLSILFKRNSEQFKNEFIDIKIGYLDSNLNFNSINS